jgi:hypothetical protein
MGLHALQSSCTDLSRDPLAGGADLPPKPCDDPE